MAALAAAVLSAPVPQAAAQQNPQWFVPNQTACRGSRASGAAPDRGATVRGARRRPRTGDGRRRRLERKANRSSRCRCSFRHRPRCRRCRKGPTPPAAIVGVLSVADVMRASTAFQQADKEFVGRRQKLNEDAQKEQVTLRDLGQALANERGKLSPEQIRNREKELQDRIGESRRVFGERNRIIQEASQYVMAQIDRAVEMVTQQVAISRGMNMVLNRAQILGVTNEFDLTPCGCREPEQGAGQRW